MPERAPAVAAQATPRGHPHATGIQVPGECVAEAMKRIRKRARTRTCSTVDLARVAGGSDDSRNIEFEMIKNIVQKLSQ
jgi:hypothetical protein